MTTLVQAFKTRMKRWLHTPSVGDEVTDIFQAFDATRQLRYKPFKALCYAPFVQLSFSPDGNASACCISRSHILGNAQQHRLDDIWRGERMQQFRTMLQNYAFPPGCETCSWSLHGGNFLSHPIRSYDDFPIHPDVLWPTKLEFALSNTCNLACVMCSGNYSSVIRAREGLPPMPKAYNEQFFEDLGPYLPHAQELSFVGGEPFLQQECYRIWDMLIDRELSPVCHVTTNGSLYNARVERVLHNLPVSLSISVDGVTKETIESIRVNNTYETLMENIRLFNAYAQGKADRYPKKRMRHLQLNYCVMQQNWHELPEFFLFAESLKARVWTVLVTYPPHCSLVALPPEDLRVVVSKLESQTSTLDNQLSDGNRTVWLELLKEMRTHAQEDPAAVNVVLESASRARAMTQDSPTGSVNLAWVYLQQGKLQEALEAALQTRSTDPLYYHALVLIAHIRTILHDYDGAEQAVMEAVKVSARRPEAYMCKAWLRYQQGRFADGLAELALAEQLVSKVPRVEHYVTAQLLRVSAFLYYRTGQAEQALGKVERYLELKPDDFDVRRLREETLAALARNDG